MTCSRKISNVKSVRIEWDQSPKLIFFWTGGQIFLHSKILEAFCGQEQKWRYVKMWGTLATIWTPVKILMFILRILTNMVILKTDNEYIFQHFTIRACRKRLRRLKSIAAYKSWNRIFLKLCSDYKFQSLVIIFQVCQRKTAI